MTWFGWALLGWWAFGVVMSIAFIGKPTTVRTPSNAIANLVITAGEVVALLLVGTGKL